MLETFAAAAKKFATRLPDLRDAVNAYLGSVVRSTLRPDDAPLALPTAIMKQLVEQHRFGAWLPYTSSMEDAQLFETSEGLGFVLEAMPLVGANDETAKLLSGLYMACPEGAGVQISIFGDNNLLPLFKAYGNLCEEDGSNHMLRPGERKQRNKNVFRVMARKRVSAYLKGCRNELSPEHSIFFNSMRIIISINVPGNRSDQVYVDRVIAVRDTIKQTLKPCGLHTITWGADRLTEFLHAVLNPNYMFADRPRDESRLYDPNKEIRHQVVSRETHTQIKANSIAYTRTGYPEVHARLLSVVSYPRRMALWETIGLTGDEFHDTLRYPCPFMITLGANVLDFHRTKADATMQSARATQNAESKMAKFQPDLQEKKQDWDVAVRRLDEGHGMVDMYHQIIIWAPPKEIDQCEETVRQIWRGRGFTIENDEYMMAQALLSALPMTLGPALTDDLKKAERLSRKTSANAVHTLPIISEWVGGCRKPVLLLWGRKGQPVIIDFFDNPQGNYNCAISGVSGSGKSFTMNEVAIRNRAAGAKVRIIDVGRSYEKLCHKLDGEYIEFTRRNPICLNPFTWINPSPDPDADEGINDAIKMIKPLIAKMVEPNHTLDTYRQSAIEKAIFDVWYEKGNAAEVSDVANKFKEAVDAEGLPDKIVRDMAMQMFSYTRGGMYGKYFAGPATISFKKDFTVLELEELKDTKDLRTVVMFVVMYRITNEMYVGGRSSRKVCMIDEAWQVLGDGADGGDFVNEGYRRARKYGGSFVCGTQGVQDYYKTPAAEAAYTNSDWKIYLRQDASEVERLTEKEKKLVLTPSEKRAMLSLRMEEGVFSEMLIKSPSGSGVARLIPDPFSLVLASSKAEDFEAINDLKKEGLSLDEAIDVLIERKALS